MLSLTRRIGESIIIGDNITVTVTVIGLSDNSTNVAIGTSALNDVSVHRQEIYDRIQNEKANSDSALLNATLTRKQSTQPIK